MWNEVTIKSPLWVKRKFVNIFSNEQNPAICDDPRGEEVARLEDLDYLFKTQTEYQGYIYDDGELNAIVGFKWSHWFNCYRITACMSGTVGSVDKLKRVATIIIEKLRWFMEKSKQTKLVILRIWGHQSQKHKIIKGDGKESVRAVPYVARMYETFWKVLEEELNRQGITFRDDDEKDCWWLYWHERVIGDPISP